MTWLTSHSKTADTKLEGVPGSSNGCVAIQRNLKRLEKWADLNLMSSREGNCKVLYWGRNNPIHWHRLGADQLENSLVEKDLEVPGGHQIEHEPAMNTCDRSHSLLFCISKITSSRLRKELVSLFSALVIPHLKCCVQCWAKYQWTWSLVTCFR